MDKNIKRNIFFLNHNKVPDLGKKVEELTEFENLKFGIAEEDIRLKYVQSLTV